MADIDDKVYRYTLDFVSGSEVEIDPAALQEGIRRHMASARKVVTDATLERIGHTHLALMINTAARFDLTLGETLMESVRLGCQPVATVCSALRSRKDSTKRVKRKPHLRLV